MPPPEARVMPHATSHEADADFLDERPAKKRKLELRVGPKQQTLDGLAFFTPPAVTPPRPPNKITLRRPGGKAIETVNGVQRELSVQGDAVAGAMREVSAPVPPAGSAASRKEEKRTLRSQDDGPKLKSELAVYFPNYEEIMFDLPREDDFINLDSVIYVADDLPKRSNTETPSPAKQLKKHNASPTSSKVNGNSDEPFAQTHAPGTTVLDFSTFLNNVPENGDDPLAKDFFLKAHKRAERKEKQLRNIERDRAMHEKVQLDRLLEGLLGHDWLKVLGITGITDSEARRYEPKRAYFIAEVQALVDKFKQWKEEEKRQRLEKEVARLAEEEEEDDDGTEVSIDAPNSDAASRQLQLETARAGKAARRLHALPQTSSHPPAQPIPYRPPSPFTTFYPDRLRRDAALKKGKEKEGVSTRRAGQVMAFGLPVPELGEREFRLPGEYVSAEVLRARGRERRRRHRESVVDASIAAG
ncbi:hypothetical protein B0A48_14438 [Cryoendolithus antarcticus]|uniref:Something about silencing protein 4 domain-containing protein n=1 Tax=Cryoendolithus antarcticus TaxID=1507870 RepID=A0A1V8SKJ6_9PEZI|nr:hypothetical protein B0A48_14438 [Cryoendolithus antarcticus]